MPSEQVQKDVDALKEAGYSTDDVGSGNKTMTSKDVGGMTDSSSRDASAAGHAARDDMAKDGTMGVPADRHGK